MKNYKLIAAWFATLSCGRELQLVFNQNNKLKLCPVVDTPQPNPTPLNRFESGLISLIEAHGYPVNNVDSVKVFICEPGKIQTLTLRGPEECVLHYFVVPGLDLKSCKALPGQGPQALTNEQVLEILAYKIKLVTSGLPDPAITFYQKTVVDFADARPRTLAIITRINGSNLTKVGSMYLSIQEPTHQLTEEDNSDIVKHADITLPGPIYPVNHVLRLTTEEMDIVFTSYETLELICRIPELQEQTSAIFNFNDSSSILTPDGLKQILRIIADDLPDDAVLPGLIPASQIRNRAREILRLDLNSCSEMLQLMSSILNHA